MTYTEPIQKRIVAQISEWREHDGIAIDDNGEAFILHGDADEWAQHVGKKVEIFASFAPDGAPQEIEFRLLPKRFDSRLDWAWAIVGALLYVGIVDDSVSLGWVIKMAMLVLAMIALFAFLRWANYEYRLSKGTKNHRL